MKRLLATAAVAMMTAICAQAQSELVIDSICTARDDGLRQNKKIYVYNDSKQNTDIYNYYYFDLKNSSIQLDEPMLTHHTVLSYDGRGVLQKEMQYSYEEKSEGALVSISEFTEWNEQAQQYAVITSHRTDELDDNSELKPRQKLVITKFHGTVGPEELELYNMDNNEWKLMGNVVYEYDDADHSVKETMDMGGVKMVTSNEYDDHDNVTKSTVEIVQSVWGAETVTYHNEVTYTNTYYDDGHLRQVVTTENGTLSQTDDYYWGQGAKNPTAIKPTTIMNSQLLERVFTLSGSRVNGQPTRPGIYIVNGKKKVIK